MNQEIKAKWIAALRSGEYKQGRRALRRNNKHCCLGVLCELHSKETGRPWDSDEIYDTIPGTLPIAVVDWAGLREANPEIPCDARYSLAEHNDGMSVRQKSFPEIADLIEKHL